MHRLQVKQVDISYDQTHVVHKASFALAEGDIGCLLGPSGCGKTTLLLAIAGFQAPSHGEVIINGKVVHENQHSVLPEKRQVGMVFQDFALFPNLSVADNIRFGIHSLTKPEQQARVNELLDLINLTEYTESYPHQLSGGQQQRVALARAMAPRPTLLLLDEPFSSLDVELRVQLAREVRNILKKEQVSAILVTHDQNEAFAMADDICVMNEGKILQQSSAYNLYHKPVNRFVADFIGEGVLIPGKVTEQSAVETEIGSPDFTNNADLNIGDQVEVLVRPDDIHFNPDSEILSTITSRSFRGAHYLYSLSLESGTEILCLNNSDKALNVGEQVTIEFAGDHVVIFKKH